MSLQPIFWAALIAGTLDICAAFVTAWLRAGVGPVRLLQFVASGLIGAAAFNGGAKTAILGLALHFLIATGATVVFYLASRKWLFLIEHPVNFGLLYGIVVYLFMNFVVLPLSSITPRPMTLSGFTIGILTIMFCVGLPIALIVRRFSHSEGAETP
ncbi:MAG TPA: hypothetical protein VFH46_03630 [Pyrinomonadaceae bacterium]|nr:hypothetical protein [Pyrinomonadaceae bacterium]